MKADVIDLFCGVGGLSYGLKMAGLNILAGYDVDSSCKYAYEANIRANFINKNIKETTANEIKECFDKSKSPIKVLVGCAPCQTFSQYTRKLNNKDDEKWTLLNEFLRIAMEIQPEIISVENVPNLKQYPIFDNFVKCSATPSEKLCISVFLDAKLLFKIKQNKKNKKNFLIIIFSPYYFF